MVKISQARRRFYREVDHQEALATEIMHNTTEMRDEGTVTREQAASIGDAVSFYINGMRRLLRDIYEIDQ